MKDWTRDQPLDTAPSRENDLRMLAELLKHHAENLTDAETEAFASMRFDLTTYGPGPFEVFKLSEKQRAWVTSVYERLVPQYSNLVSRGLVPRGREVPTPAVLKNLPKRPPKR